MKKPKTFEEFKKETAYPYLATMTQFDNVGDNLMREELKRFGAEKYQKGFDMALKILSDLGETELVEKIKENYGKI